VLAGVEERDELVGEDERANVEREVAPEELDEERQGWLGDGETESPSESIEGGVSEIKGGLIHREPEECKKGQLSRGENKFGEVEPRGVPSLEHEEVKSLANDRAPRTQVFGGVFASEAEGAR
jgi:hypothetical protein